MEDTRGEYRVVLRETRENPNAEIPYEELLKTSAFARKHLVRSRDEANDKYQTKYRGQIGRTRPRHTFFIVEPDTYFYNIPGDTENGYMISNKTLEKVDLSPHRAANAGDPTSPTDFWETTQGTFAIWCHEHHFDWRLWKGYNYNHSMTPPSKISRIYKRPRYQARIDRLIASFESFMQ